MHEPTKCETAFVWASPFVLKILQFLRSYTNVKFFMLCSGNAIRRVPTFGRELSFFIVWDAKDICTSGWGIKYVIRSEEEREQHIWARSSSWWGCSRINESQCQASKETILGCIKIEDTVIGAGQCCMGLSFAVKIWKASDKTNRKGEESLEVWQGLLC